MIFFGGALGPLLSQGISGPATQMQQNQISQATQNIIAQQQALGQMNLFTTPFVFSDKKKMLTYEYLNKCIFVMELV